MDGAFLASWALLASSLRGLADSTEIRGYLGGAKRFRRLLDLPVDNVVYVVTCKCFPLMGGVISSWLFFGAQVPLAVSRASAGPLPPPPQKSRGAGGGAGCWCHERLLSTAGRNERGTKLGLCVSVCSLRKKESRGCAECDGVPTRSNESAWATALRSFLQKTLLRRKPSTNKHKTPKTARENQLLRAQPPILLLFSPDALFSDRTGGGCYTPKR